MEKKNGPSRLEATLIILGCIVCIVGIVFLKTASDSRSPAYAKINPKVAARRAAADSASNVAVPNVNLDSTVMPLTPDTIPPAPADSIGKDTRPALEAGRQDGFLAGEDDAHNDRPHASYDDTNTFSSAAEQQAYKHGYAEGYAEGLEAGASLRAEEPAHEKAEEGTEPKEQ